MSITSKEQAANAIQWIDSLPDYPQADKNNRCRLGNWEKGFCCIGAGCTELGVEYDLYEDEANEEFAVKVGLRDEYGELVDPHNQQDGSFLFYGEKSLARINDETNAGFKRIARLMKVKPYLMFQPDVAELIEQHYQKVGE